MIYVVSFYEVSGGRGQGLYEWYPAKGVVTLLPSPLISHR